MDFGRFTIGFDPSDKERVYNYWDQIFSSHNWTEGKFTRLFEEKWERWNGVQAVATSSWAGAALACLEYFNVRGKTILCPTNTFMATPLSVVKAGGEVVFGDCNREDLCLSYDAVVSAAERHDLAAVWLVHIGGHIAFDTLRIAEFCRSKGIVLLEDCAHAHGASWNGRKPGVFGDAGVYSFYATKSISTGEGGMLVSKHPSLIEFAMKYRNYGKFEHEVEGLNYRMSEFTAALGEPVVQGSLGLDAGSGCGPDTASMARRYPSVEILSLDISEGVYRTKYATAMLPNVHVIRASVLALPLRPGMCDFGYSFGVLHHTTDPQRGLQEIVRVLKANARVILYLYEDHADNPWKAAPLKAVTALRQLTTKLQPRILSALCYLLSPLVVVTFSIPARMLSRFGPTRALADQMPFNFGTSLFSVHGDLVDRFGAPIEIRYNREGVIALLQTCGLTEIRTTRLRTSAGWVARGVTRSQ
jgi:SAM-dependent methyltransferase